MLEYDFLQKPEGYSNELKETTDKSEIIVAADTIYDDTLTDGFIKVLDYIFSRAGPFKLRKTVYVALEKLFVFTLTEFDAVAPMFEYFVKQTMNKKWRFLYSFILGSH